jgi:hypothetical protein
MVTDVDVKVRALRTLPENGGAKRQQAGHMVLCTRP